MLLVWCNGGRWTVHQDQRVHDSVRCKHGRAILLPRLGKTQKKGFLVVEPLRPFPIHLELSGRRKKRTFFCIFGSPLVWEQVRIKYKYRLFFFILYTPSSRNIQKQFIFFFRCDWPRREAEDVLKQRIIEKLKYLFYNMIFWLNRLK